MQTPSEKEAGEEEHKQTRLHNEKPRMEELVEEERVEVKREVRELEEQTYRGAGLHKERLQEALVRKE